MPSEIEQLTATLRTGRDLSHEQAARAFAAIMAGQLPDDEVAAFMAALADKGETVDEIVAAAETLRRHVTPIPCDDPNTIDTCGTGGDGISTFNVSTAAALIAAGAGVRVAKHGNRTNTRKSGSAEALQALGVRIEAGPAVVARCIREAGIGFLYAANLHPAMKHAAAARRMLGRRTIFNLLGPLTNPAGVRRQVIGVARLELLEPLAEALRRLGAVRAMVVHGDDGLCDLTVTGASRTVELREGRTHRRTVRPEDVGLRVGPAEALRVETPQQSAEAIRAILAGEPGPRRDHALLNAAAALVVAGAADELSDAVLRAAAAIDTGAAMTALNRLIEISGGTR